MKERLIYIFAIIMFIFILVQKFILNNFLPDLSGFISAIFWIIMFVAGYQILGISKNRNTNNKKATQIVLASIIIYLMSTYLIGLFIGYVRTPYSYKIINIIKNLYPVLIMIIVEEYMRYMVAKRCVRDSKPLIVLTIVYIVIDIVLITTTLSFSSFRNIYNLICFTIVPIIGRHMLSSYLTYNIGLTPSLTLRLILESYIYIIPCVTNLSKLITCILNITLLFVIFIIINKMLQKAEHNKIEPIKSIIVFGYVPLIICGLFFITLISGLFKYKILAIGSTSMEPTIHRGDAIIYEKYDDSYINDLDINTIIVFNTEGKTVTHRIVDITSIGDTTYYVTQGDNKSEEDDVKITSENILGIVRLDTRFVGWPTILISENL